MSHRRGATSTDRLQRISQTVGPLPAAALRLRLAEQRHQQQQAQHTPQRAAHELHRVARRAAAGRDRIARQAATCRAGANTCHSSDECYVGHASTCHERARERFEGSSGLAGSLEGGEEDPRQTQRCELTVQF